MFLGFSLHEQFKVLHTQPKCQQGDPFPSPEAVPSGSVLNFPPHLSAKRVLVVPHPPCPPGACDWDRDGYTKGFRLRMTIIMGGCLQRHILPSWGLT